MVEEQLFEERYGIDISSEVIELGKKILAEKKTPNCILETGNIFQLSEKFLGKFDGVISLQTFNILPDYR
ncbi:MAG: class I SAM-dependent methyltransferase [Lachnospiraceae bacterium]|nr:class I SAM-dependent methyltransferase [Lachnospiraceae bacterium]